MFYHQHSDAFFRCQIAQVLKNLHCKRPGNPCNRLVEQEEARRTHKGPAYINKLTLSARQLACEVVRHVCHLEQVQYRISVGQTLFLGAARTRAQQRKQRTRCELLTWRHEKVLDHGHFSPQPCVLEGPCQAQLLYLVRPHARGILSKHLDPARGQFQQSGNAVERGRLAAPVGTDQPDKFAFLNLERDTIDGPEAAKILCQFRHSECRRRHRYPAFSSSSKPSGAIPTGRLGLPGISGSRPFDERSSAPTMTQPIRASFR